VVEATEDAPCLAVWLKLDVRWFVSSLARRVKIAGCEDAQPRHVGTGEVRRTCSARGAGCLPSFKARRGTFRISSGVIEREILYRNLRGPEGAASEPSPLGDQESPHRPSSGVDTGNVCQATSR